MDIQHVKKVKAEIKAAKRVTKAVHWPKAESVVVNNNQQH
jgi:hypothetical protein